MRITLRMQKNFLLISFTPKYQMNSVNPGRLDASKPTRNGSFISMIPILIVTGITCADINDLVVRANNYPDITEEHRQEVIDLYDDISIDLGLDCRDAKAD